MKRWSGACVPGRYASETDEALVLEWLQRDWSLPGASRYASRGGYATPTKAHMARMLAEDSPRSPLMVQEIINSQRARRPMTPFERVTDALRNLRSSGAITLVRRSKINELGEEEEFMTYEPTVQA